MQQLNVLYQVKNTKQISEHVNSSKLGIFTKIRHRKKKRGVNGYLKKLECQILYQQTHHEKKQILL